MGMPGTQAWEPPVTLELILVVNFYKSLGNLLFKI